MDLSLIIPAYNEAERLVSTLSSAIAFLDSRSWSYEIIVVDDGSTDGMGALVDDFARRFPQVRPLHNESNRGKGFSIRVGVSQGSGEVVGFIDADDKTDLAALDGA
ncbi:MAG TPA: glycosyltransferase, partial [Candidatus Latescibacteria bacterium]|nr:glycosyltransferase [Candidatus Latescibacterota bacterium]